MRKDEFLQWARTHLTAPFLQQYGEQLEREVEHVPWVDNPWFIVDQVQMRSINMTSYERALNSPLNSS